MTAYTSLALRRAAKTTDLSLVYIAQTEVK